MMSSKNYFSSWRKLWGLLKPYHLYFYLGLTSIFILQGWSISWTWLSGMIITSVSHQNWQRAGLVVAIMFAGSVFASLVEYFNDWNYIVRLGSHLRQHMQGYSLTRILRLTIAQHKDQHSAIKLDVVDQGENAIRSLLNRMFYSFFPTLFYICLSFAMLFRASVVFGSASVGVFVGILCWSLYFQKRNYDYVKQDRDNWNEQRKDRQEAFTHLELVKTLGRESYFTSKYLAARAKVVKFSNFVDMRGARSGLVRMFTSDMLTAASLGYAVYLYAHGRLEIGMIFVVFSLTARVMGQVGNLERAIRETPQDWANVEKYLTLTDREPSFSETGDAPVSLSGDIVFTDVTFNYPGHPAVIENFSVTIPSGKTTAFVGHSGSGKTTIGRLLLRAYPYEHGSISIGGQELTTIDAKKLRERVGAVEQHVDLFDDTVRENILIGTMPDRRDAVNANLDEIAKRARIDEFAYRLGEVGYDALVGERGLKLSGGERQRVGIARAIAKEPDIYLFDEATASLDAVNEKHVMDAVYDAAKGKTTIIIAHRLSTVRHADKIVVTERGRIVAEGTHDELMEKSHEYRELVHHQMSEEDK